MDDFDFDWTEQQLATRHCYFDRNSLFWCACDWIRGDRLHLAWTESIAAELGRDDGARSTQALLERRQIGTVDYQQGTMAPPSRHERVDSFRPSLVKVLRSYPGHIVKSLLPEVSCHQGECPVDSVSMLTCCRTEPLVCIGSSSSPREWQYSVLGRQRLWFDRRIINSTFVTGRILCFIVSV